MKYTKEEYNKYVKELPYVNRVLELSNDPPLTYKEWVEEMKKIKEDRK